MSIIVDMVTSLHRFEKTNLMTLSGGYDEYKCTQCGLKGRRYSLQPIITIPRVTKDRPEYHLCPEAPMVRHRWPIGKDLGQLVVTHCSAQGPEFAKATPGSVHNLIPTPAGEKRIKGEWIMGATEPILLLHNEFNIIKIQ